MQPFQRQFSFLLQSCDLASLHITLLNNLKLPLGQSSHFLMLFMTLMAYFQALKSTQLKNNNSTVNAHSGTNSRRSCSQGCGYGWTGLSLGPAKPAKLTCHHWKSLACICAVGLTNVTSHWQTKLKQAMTNVLVVHVLAKNKTKTEDKNLKQVPYILSKRYAENHCFYSWARQLVH